MTFQEFKTYWEKSLPTKPDYIRTGQSLMTTLNSIRPDLYDKISDVNFERRNELDCFYNSKLVQPCLQYLESIW